MMLNRKREGEMNSECNEKTCPWRGGYSLSGKFRKLFHDPDKILRDYLRPDMWVLDVGCGMGYMAIGAASAVGESGKVVIVDIQREMLDAAERRLSEAGLKRRTVSVQCRQRSLCIEAYRGRIDFAYAFMMVHEADNREHLLQEIYDSLKEGGALLIAEPYMHVPKKDFQETVACAQSIGFACEPSKRRIGLCRSVVCRKSAANNTASAQTSL